jgi:tetratricopeptide (TPR) repeat protein
LVGRIDYTDGTVNIIEGIKLGSYEILERLGEGGMGVVHRALDTRLNRQVAVKVLSSTMSADPQARERLRREALAAASLDHPYVCKIFEIGEDLGVLFLVMEFVPGETLHHRLHREKMGLAESLRVAQEVAEALEEAHARRLVHRDLKPANIMLTSQGHVKVMDFGLAKQVGDGLAGSAETLAADAGPLTAAGTIVGTPDYMSPEQVSGCELDVRSDQFSFGVILAEMLSGSHPFRRSTMMETLSAVLRDTPDIRGDMPQSLRVVVRRMLAKAPEERFANINEVRGELKRVAALAESGGDEDAEHRLPPIGRDAELKLLMRHLEEGMAGRGSVVLVGGEPGIGKTHLTTALAEAARLRGALVRIGHCYEAEGSAPYTPFIEVLETTLRTGSAKNLRFALGDDAAEVARIMPELRTVYPDIPPALEVPPDQQRRLLFSAYRSFMERAARLTPIVYIYEDMHWADDPTLLMIEQIAKHLGELSVLMVITYRDVDLEVGRPFARTLENLLKQKLATRILLRRLPVEGVEKMLAALSAQTPPKSLARVVFEETEGNPFFVEEVFRHLVEEGRLFDEKGAFLPGLKVDQLQVPEGVRLVLGRRLQRLSDDARRILTTAAVLGRSFPLHLLEELEKGNPDAVLDALEEAERAHLVESESRGRETRYRFVHELVRHTLIETLSLPRRQRLHARIAEGMERVYASTVTAHIPMLAHHLYEAGLAADAEKTVHYLTEAANQATAAAAYEEAIGHLDNALSLIEGEISLRAGELHAQRGAALPGARRSQEAIPALERAADIFEQAGEWVDFVDTCYKLFNHFAWALQLDRMGQLASRVERAGQSAPPFVRRAALVLQAVRVGLPGRIDESLKLLEQATQVPAGDLPARIAYFENSTERSLRLYAGQVELCEAASRRNVQLLDPRVDSWELCSSAFGLIYGPMMCGRPLEAIKVAEEIVPIATRVGHIDGLHAARGLRGLAYLALGDLERAEHEEREAYEFARGAKLGYASATGASLGVILSYLGRAEEGLALLRQATEFIAGYLSAAMPAFLAIGLAAAGQDSRDAEAACRTLLHPPGVSRSTGIWNGVVALAEVLALQGRSEEAADLLPDAERVATEWDVIYIGYPVRTAAGIAAAAAGDLSRSEEHHRAAIARMDSCGYKLGSAIARIRYADMLRMRRAAGDEAAARELLEAGLRQSEAIGLALYARVAREKLAGQD